MLTPLHNLVRRYTERLKGGPHATLLLLREAWPQIAEKHAINSESVAPAELTEHKLVLSCSSSEEAAVVRMKKRKIIQDINNDLSLEITNITFT